MGRQQGGQDHLFYSFNLESIVPQKHLLRGIDRCLDLTDLRQHLAEYYSYTGRPSIDPVLMIRMLVVGYCYGIRSERCLCEEVNLNLAYRWFCRLGLEDVVPNYSTFSKNRHGRYWLDLGNTEASAQVVLGQGPRRENVEANLRLPCVTELFPELLDASVPDDNRPTCLVRVSLASQGLFINDVAVRFAAQLLYELFSKGRLNQQAW